MKRTLSAAMLLAAVVTGYSSGAAAQQASRDDLRHLSDQAREPAAAVYRNEEEGTPESRPPQGQRPQPAGEDALQGESHGSGLAPKPYKATTTIRIEQVPRYVGAEDASRLVGKSAVSRRGEEVGEISAVVRSPTDGLLAVVDVGKFFGVGVSQVMLPIEPGEIDRNGNLTVQVSREELERMQRYDARIYP